MELKKRLDDSIHAWEAKLAKMKALSAALDDQDVVAELEKALGISNGTPQVTPQKRRRYQKKNRTVFDRIVDFFKSSKNEWATLVDIADAVGTSVSSVRQTVYRAKVDYFERTSIIGGGRPSTFRLVKNFDELRAKEEKGPGQPEPS